MTNHEKRISIELDQAREKEAHYRALLLFWKQRRQRLENRIPLDDPFSEFIKTIIARNH